MARKPRVEFERNGSVSTSVHFYNRLGQKTQVIDASGTNTFACSDPLQLTNETQLASFDIARSYDSFGRSAAYSLQTTNSEPQTVTYGYDSLGRFSSVSSSVQSVSPYQLAGGCPVIRFAVCCAFFIGIAPVIR